MVALDLDGTLLTSDKRVTPRARSAIRRLAERGVHVVVCTGRPPRSAFGYAVELGLGHRFVCFHGAALADPSDGTLRVRHALDPAVARGALGRLRAAFPELMAGLETDHGWYLDPALFDLRTSEARLGPEAGVGAPRLGQTLEAESGATDGEREGQGPDRGEHEAHPSLDAERRPLAAGQGGKQRRGS